LCHEALENKDISTAAKYANEDIVFSHFLRGMTKKSIYGFVNQINDIKQIFSTLGIGKSKAVIESYIIQKLFPENEYIFNMSRQEFTLFMDNLINIWEVILNKKCKNSAKVYTSLASLVGATIIFIKSLFEEHKDEIKVINNFKRIDFNTILVRLTGISVMELSLIIAKELELNSNVTSVLKLLINNENSNYSDEIIQVSKLFKLTMLYVMSIDKFVKHEVDKMFNIDKNFNQNEIEEFFMMVQKI
jgi:hypothetical protein